MKQKPFSTPTTELLNILLTLSGLTLEQVLDRALREVKQRKPTQPLPAVCNTHYMLTLKGVVDCNGPKFEPSSYHDINYNTRKRRKHASSK